MNIAHLDPKAPLVLDMRELGSRPGSHSEIHRTVPAPADLGIEVLGVVEGAPVELDLRIEAVMEGVLVTCVVNAALEGECVRCLEPLSDTVETRFQELYLNSDAGHDPDEDEESGVSRLVDDLVDLEPAVRDAVVLALPFQPLCEEDCPGLCPDCGARLKDDPEHTHGEPIDPRWAGLAGLAAETDNQD